MLNCFCFYTGQKESSTTFYRDREIHPCVKDLQRPLQGLIAKSSILQIIDTEWISMSLYEVMVDYFSPTTIQPSLERWTVGPLFNLREKKKHFYLKKVAAFWGMHVSPAKHSYASVTDGQTDDGQSDPYMSLCFAGDTKTNCLIVLLEKGINVGLLQHRVIPQAKLSSMG